MCNVYEKIMSHCSQKLEINREEAEYSRESSIAFVAQLQEQHAQLPSSNSGVILSFNEPTTHPDFNLTGT